MYIFYTKFKSEKTIINDWFCSVGRRDKGLRGWRVGGSEPQSLESTFMTEKRGREAELNKQGSYAIHLSDLNGDRGSLHWELYSPFWIIIPWYFINREI